MELWISQRLQFGTPPIQPVGSAPSRSLHWQATVSYRLFRGGCAQRGLGAGQCIQAASQPAGESKRAGEPDLQLHRVRPSILSYLHDSVGFPDVRAAGVWTAFGGK